MFLSFSVAVSATTVEEKADGENQKEWDDFTHGMFYI